LRTNGEDVRFFVVFQGFLRIFYGFSAESPRSEGRFRPAPTSSRQWPLSGVESARDAFVMSFAPSISRISRDDPLDHVAVDVGQAVIAPGMPVSQFLVVQP
jgi:hypothetical protein